MAVNPTSIAPKASTPEDTLQRKSHEAGGVSGGHLGGRQQRPFRAAKYGEPRINVGNLLGEAPLGRFAEMLGRYGEEVRDPVQIAGALRRSREQVAKTRRCARVNIWVDPREYAPGTKNQTMYK